MNGTGIIFLARRFLIASSGRSMPARRKAANRGLRGACTPPSRLRSQRIFAAGEIDKTFAVKRLAGLLSLE
jgi:hypothetical protein